MSVAENVAFGLPGRPRGRSAAEHPRVKDLAGRVGIDRLLSRRPGTLSGGERQRTAIARALAPSPGAILYDEPLANLDPSRRADLRRLLAALSREEKTTLVYVTHDPEEALEIGDEVVVLSRGRVVDRGAPEDVYRSPRTLEGARSLGAVNAFPAREVGGAWTSALGALSGADGPVSGTALALVRPEHVVAADAAGPGADAVVESSWLRGAEWAFSALLGDARVVGRSARRLAPGERVRLHVKGPAVLLAPEPGRNP
jgi:ABC-type sulfate/molybdate transport systems ATPase subunit